MEKIISKKLLRGLCALSAGFILASCDPVKALPTNHAEGIVYNENGKVDVKENELLEVYKLVESGKNSEAVQMLLREIAEKQFGTYEDFYKIVKGEKTLASFIAEEGKKEVREKYFGTDVKTQERRFEDFKNDIKDRISEFFYNEITSGSYNDEDGKFSEKKFYNSKRYELYDLHALDEKDADDKKIIDNEFYVTNTLTKENAFDSLKGIYHKLNAGERGYIEEKVYPDILKNKLVESYIYDNNPSSLGRAYARKINYIKVSYDDEFAGLRNMLEYFADKYIETENSVMDFELIAHAIKGFSVFNVSSTQLINKIDGSDDETDKNVCKLLEAAEVPEDKKFITVPDTTDYVYGKSLRLVPAGKYYRETKLGKILESYALAIKAEKAGRFVESDLKAELDKFTAEGKSKEYGLMQKIISLAKEDYTTDGWYLKNGGATELPSVIRDRLFNIKVANILDDNKDIGEHKAALPEEATIGTYNAKNYLRNIEGKKLVLPSDALSFDKDHYNYIYQDTSGKAFYICEVLEAPSTAKFSETSELAYKCENGKDVDTDRIELLKRQIAKILGTKDSYIKDAYTEFLKKYKFEFFDTSLFEYLDNEYPDLELSED